MSETVICPYCSSVIPADAEVCPMCGADVTPDELEDAPELTGESVTTSGAVVIDAPLFSASPEIPQAPDLVTPLRTNPSPAPLQGEVFSGNQGLSGAPNNRPRNVLILAGIVFLLVSCLCVIAIVATLAAQMR
ncbi:MAG TPA: zinc ribbon domain-containing protein [Anaerolineales bacterium]|nr:zinc ribbon domain-containing protein [Anaerolineales bacterium]